MVQQQSRLVLVIAVFTVLFAASYCPAADGRGKS
jgi:hypothetical protein